MTKNDEQYNLKDNIEVIDTKKEIQYQNDSILMRMVAKESGGNVVFLALDKGQGLVEHAASSNAIIYLIEGKLEFYLKERQYNLEAGNLLPIPAKVPHSLFAVTKTKALLIVL